MNTPAESFGPFLTNRFGERYLPTVNREIFSSQGADALFQRQLGGALFLPDSLYLIVGSDSGLLINHLLRKGPALGSQYIFIELPGVIARLRQEGIAATLPAKVHLASPEEWIYLARNYSAEKHIFTDTLRLIKSMATVDLFWSGYLELWKEVYRQVRIIQTDAAIGTGTQVFMERALDNLAENRIPLIHLRGCFAGHTAVILAGGPSLDEVLPWVKQQRERLVVLAISRISQRLLEEGIVPDLVFAIDPYDQSFFESRDLLRLGTTPLFVHMYHVHPRLLGQWPGRSVYMGYRLPWVTELNQPNLMFEGITVSNQALGAAVELGFSTVILGGVDLCFTREGFTHAGGSPERAAGPFVDPPDIFVDTNGGWVAESRQDFYNAAQSLAVMAEWAVKERRVRLINPAAGAAAIPLIEFVALHNLPLAAPVVAGEIIARQLPADDPTERVSYFQAALVELQRIRKRFDQVKVLAGEGLECNDKLFGRRGHPPNFKFKKQMDRVEEELNQKFAAEAELVKKWGVREFLRLGRPGATREWSDAEVEETGRRYYTIYRDAAVKLLGLVDQATLRLRARLEEQQPRVNFKLLLEQWERDRQPGRLELWLGRHPEGGVELPPPLAARVAGLREQYRGQFTEAAAIPVVEVTVAAVLNKGRFFFQMREGERLRAFAAGLERLGRPGLGPVLRLLAGFQAELVEDYAAARDHYRALGESELREDAWLRLSAVTIRQGDYPAALEVLERLAALSMGYVPQYADLLRIAGQLRAAATALAEYLKIATRDPVAQLKLGELYRELGEREQALRVVNELLAGDPGNVAALQLAESLALQSDFFAV